MLTNEQTLPEKNSTLMQDFYVTGFSGFIMHIQHFLFLYKHNGYITEKQRLSILHTIIL